jgi:hypothetical protein
MSVGLAEPRLKKKIRLADFGDVEFIEVELSIGSGTYGTAVGYAEIRGVKK